LLGNNAGCVEVIIPKTPSIAAASEIEIMGRMPQNCEVTFMVQQRSTFFSS